MDMEGRMDPDATLAALNSSVDSGEVFEAFRRAEELFAWLDHDGMEPEWKKYPEATRYFVMTFYRFLHSVPELEEYYFDPAF